MSVVHEPGAGRFILSVSSGTAVLLYASAGDGVLDLYSTFVPTGDRGKGVADRLVQAAVAHARAQGLRIIPSCWYVAVWLQRHPEHADLIVA